MSPTLNVPALTSTVDVKPLPLSSEDSTTVPIAGLSGFAFRSSISASSRILSRRIPMFNPVIEEISCDWYFPPQSSTR
jgi:hypothetical protein